jgi:uncharacterized protein (DUF2062 family)
MNLKALFQRFLPTRQQMHGHPHLRWIGDRLFDSDVWHLTRRSAAGGAAVGVFFSFIPVPGQVLLGVLVALLLRVNVPLAAAGAFISNPLTMAPMLYACYRAGAWLMGLEHQPLHFEPTLEWVRHAMAQLWQPVYLGSIVLGALSALAAWVAVRLIWRLHSVNRW